MYRNTYVEINLNNIYNNAKNIINAYNGYEYYIGVVKSNCYGHGSYSVTELLKAGVNYLAVSNLLEAKNIRSIDKKVPILCLEPINMEYIDMAIKLNVTITITSLEYLKLLTNKVKNKNMLVHIKINSGMNRLGFNDKNELVEAYNTIREYYTLEGIYSHFSTIGYLDNKYIKQIDNFKEITSLIDLSKIKIVHMGKSSTLINHDKIDFCNGTRLGIILYGIDMSIHKSNNILKVFKNNVYRNIKNIDEINYGAKAKFITSLSLYTQVIDVSYINKDEYIGYGFQTKLNKGSYTAVISIGYADGISIKGSNRYVYINGEKYLILAVTSNKMIIKVNQKVNIGDTVEIYGNNISIREMGRCSDTNSYDLFARIHESIPRVYVKNKIEVYKEIWEIK